MSIIIPILGLFIILVPIVIMLISFKVYNNTGNKKKLVMYTLPNFILTVAIPVLMSFFATYGRNYIYAFEAFLNGIANGNIYMCTMFVLIILQVVVTCINAVAVAKEMKHYTLNKKEKSFKLSKSSAIVLACVGIIFISFLVTDICRLEQNLEPIFCLRMGAYSDGGTKKYLGLEYKIIDYNKLDGYDGYKIGTWFMSYDNSL